mmetsp:Transcript_20193/g.26679  ORF Transcript_20193/g.26679 Transcript_20193/m.26679 type:complete len:225 (-) Transcript_20193:126-800(-)
MAYIISDFQTRSAKLPNLFRETLNSIREIDQRCAELDDEVHQAFPKSSIKKLDASQVKKLKVSTSKWIEQSNQKVDLAAQAYATLDAHIRSLDHDIARVEAELRQRGVKTGLASSTEKNKNEPGDTKGGEVDSSTATEKKRATSILQGMPIVESEPTYCICRNVAYGDMVACDNPECAQEWFHFACVGLSKQPASGSEWLCPNCRSRGKKKKKNSKVMSSQDIN